MSARGFVGFVLDDVEKIIELHGDAHPAGTGASALAWATRNLDGLLLGDPGGALDRIRALRVVPEPPTPGPAGIERLLDLVCEQATTLGIGEEHYRGMSPEEVLAYVQGSLDLFVDAGLAPGLTAADVEHVRAVLSERADGDRDDLATAPIEELFDTAARDLDAVLLTGLILDGSGFPADSVYCEWGYLIDLDRSRFEVYRGFQESRPTQGRFARREQAHPLYFPVAPVASWPLVELPDRIGLLAALPDDDWPPPGG